MTNHGQEPLLAEKVHANDEESDFSDSGPSELGDEDMTPRAVDRRLLAETEQHESLLSKPSRLDGVRKAFGKSRFEDASRRTRLRGKRVKDQAEGSGGAELIYEMEGGYKDTSSRSSQESLALKQEKWQTQPTRRSYLRFFCISVGILIIFLILLFGSYKASRKSNLITKLSNGTHYFAPTTILISLDGFRADFLQRDLTPALNAFIASGVSPKYMLPSFPTLTFPNHFTLVTGLYPESHGIVSNQFWDPAFQEEFWYTNTSNSMQPKWWNAEPLWVTAEKQGVKTAIHMWPGSEAHVMNTDPTYLDKFNSTEALDVKVSRILEWLDMPEDDRPQFIGAYVPNVDQDGHGFGPNSTEIRGTIVEVDQMLTNLIDGLFHRNLTDVVNIVIVSDHGMATTSNDRLVQLDDIVDVGLIDHMDGWPLRGLRLKDPDQDLAAMHHQLLDASDGASFKVYNKTTMPERYHFTNNDRIAPLWIVPDPGWVVIEKADFDIAQAQADGRHYEPLGLHGYDHEHPLMRAIFVARGPAFPHLPNSRLNPFQNTEVYNIVCDSLGIEPHPNNGTLRLPLKTEGLHSDFGDETIPSDPVIASTTAVAETTNSQPSETATVESEVPVATPSETSEEVLEPEESGKASWWDFLHNKLEQAKDWAKQLVGSLKQKLGHNDPTG